ncbi:MAG: ATP-binding cassette domain-containing protein [Chitinophagaceae bacterium]|nr:ATP-binding cassette domain-containing protein [Chitinophagaceae bacterium]
MDHKKAINRVWELIGLHRKDIISIYFFAIFSGLVNLTLPIGIQSIVGFVLGASMVTSIYVLIFLVVLGVFTVGFLQISQMRIIEKIQQNLFVVCAIDFTEKIPRFDLKKTDKYYLPEKVNRFFDIVNVQKGISKMLLDIPVASIQILFGLLLLSFYHPIFIALGIFLVLILGLILKLTSNKGIDSSNLESKYKYAVVAWLQDMARTLKSFKFTQGSHLNLKRTDNLLLNYLDARTKHFKILMFQYKTLVFFKVAITSAMLIIGSILLINQELNIGEFIAAEIVIIAVIGAVEKLITSLEVVYDVITGLEKLAIVQESPLEHTGKNIFNDDEQFNFKMNKLSFAYRENNFVLTDVNLEIPANKLTVISGKSGSAKTTILKLLSGAFSDFEGALLLNNLPIQNYNLSSLRSQTGMYLQEFDVFEGTVFENISLGKCSISNKMILDKAEELGFQHFISNFHDGFETQIETGGTKLPQALIKKILLLRAVVHQPKLLLLEEPWQGFMEKEKQKMILFLSECAKNNTVIIVSNENDIIEKADVHISFNNGICNTLKF